MPEGMGYPKGDAILGKIKQGEFGADVGKTKNGKLYWVVEVIDNNNQLTKIRCWGVKPEKDRILLNRPYMARLKYDEQWGFSTYAIGRTFKLLG